MVSMYGRGNHGTGLLFQWGSQTEPSVCTMRAFFFAGPVLFIEGSKFISRGVASNEAEEATASSLFCARARVRVNDII